MNYLQNPQIRIVLFGLYIALGSFYMALIVHTLLPKIIVANFLSHVLGVGLWYLVGHFIFRKLQLNLTKKMIFGALLLLGVFLLAIAITTFSIYLKKLQFDASL